MMAAPAPPESAPGNGWASPFGAADMRPFDDDLDASRRSGNGNGPLPATMHQRRPSDPSLPADFSGFTLLTRRSKSVTLPSGGPASREGSQHDALFASTVGDVRKEESSPTSGLGGRTWNPFKRKAAAKKAAEEPQTKPAAPPAAVPALENSTSRRWGRSKAPAALPPAAAGVPGAAGAALNIDVRDAEPAAPASAGPGAPQAGSERPASAPATVKAAAGGQPQQAMGVSEAGEAPHDSAAAHQAGANGGARWFGRSPGKPTVQAAAAPPPRVADALPKASAVGKSETAGPGPGRFGALFSGIQRSSMSRPANVKGRAKAADEPPSVARDSGEAATGAEFPFSLPRIDAVVALPGRAS